jgi:hypothetical protein
VSGSYRLAGVKLACLPIPETLSIAHLRENRAALDPDLGDVGDVAA